jgi:pseudouridine kinase
MGTSNPVDGQRSFGGVARNVAENLARLGVATGLLSIVGEDENGRALLEELAACGIDRGLMRVDAGRRTAEYSAILGPEGDLALGLADMGVLDGFSVADLDRNWPRLVESGWVFTDCNPPAEMLAALIARRRGAGFRLAVDTVSTPKAARLPADLEGVDLLFVNRDEAAAYLAATGRAPGDDEAAALRDAGAARVVLTLGAEGVVVADESGTHRVAAVPANRVDATGAGDSMVAATLYRCLQGDTLVAAVRVGTLLAALTIETPASVHPALSPAFLQAHMSRLGLEPVA